MKTLNIMNVKGENKLNRSEMKTIVAGSGCDGGMTVGGGCLYCFTPNGSEGWYRQKNPGNQNALDEECRDIYPAYPDGTVSGGWDAGGSC